MERRETEGDRRARTDGGREPADSGSADADRWSVGDAPTDSQHPAGGRASAGGGNDAGVGRRQLLLGAGGAVAAWYFLFGDSKSEEQRVKDVITGYYAAISNDDEAAVDRLIHSESPQGDVLGRTGRDIRVEGFESVTVDGQTAAAEVLVTFDTGTGTGEGAPDVELRKEDGNWRIWRFT